MKRFIVKTIEHLIYTVISVIVVLAAFVIHEYVTSYWKGAYSGSIAAPQETHYMFHEEITPNFLISEQRIIEGGEHFMVTGKITNISESVWTSVNMKVVQYVDGIKVGECYNSNNGRDFENYQPGKSYSYVVECESISGRKLPEGFSYDLRFTSGTIFSPNKSGLGTR